MTPAKAAKFAERLVEALEAGVEGWDVPVLRCKLATARQRYWCSNARRLTAAKIAAKILQPEGAANRIPQRGQPLSPVASASTSCVVKTPNGRLWLVDRPGRCWAGKI